MEYVKYEDAVVHENSSRCKVYEYPMKNSEMGYVLKGSGKLVTETTEVFLSAGDAVYMPHGEKYYWEGTMTVVLPATPAWHPAQHERAARS